MQQFKETTAKLAEFWEVRLTIALTGKQDRPGRTTYPCRSSALSRGNRTAAVLDFHSSGTGLIRSIALVWYHPEISPNWAIWGNLMSQLTSHLLTAIFWGRWQPQLSRDPRPLKILGGNYFPRRLLLLIVAEELFEEHPLRCQFVLAHRLCVDLKRCLQVLVPEDLLYGL
jgi:hypothetical protein